MNVSVFAALFVSGFLGSFGHCLGMCGPLILMVSSQIKNTGKQAVPYWFFYHGSRVLVYVILGAIVGELGSLIGFGPSLSKVAGIISLLLSVAIVLFGLSYLGWLPFGKLRGFGDWWGKIAGKVMRVKGIPGVILLGLLNGVLPCGLVYGALLVASTTGNLTSGAAAMLAFGMGTLPVLITLAVGASSIRQKTRIRFVLTKIAGIFMLLIGTQIFMRSLKAFHLVPGFKIGGIVFW